MTREELLEFFKTQTLRMVAVCAAKNADYTGATDDPFANFTRVQALGICSAEVGFLTRMTDKLCRISSFVAKGNLQIKEESVSDTLMDLANYAVLMAAYLKSKNVSHETKG